MQVSNQGNSYAVNCHTLNIRLGLNDHRANVGIVVAFTEGDTELIPGIWSEAKNDHLSLDNVHGT